MLNTLHQLMVILVLFSWCGVVLLSPFGIVRSCLLMRYCADRYKEEIWPGKAYVGIWDAFNQMSFYRYLCKRKYLNTVDKNDLPRFESVRKLYLLYFLLMLIAMLSFGGAITTGPT